MRKQTLKKSFLFFATVLLSVLLAATAFPQPKVAAGTQDNVLWLVGFYCHDLEDISKEFDRGIGRKDIEETYAHRCSSHSGGSFSSWENVLSEELGCSTNMFYSHDFQTDPNDSSVVKTQWFTKEGAYKACYNKASAKYDFLAGNTCRTMRRDSGNWQACEDAQNAMHKALGCDDRMFQDLNNGYWGPKPNALNDCASRVNAVGNVKIRIIVNGEVVESPNQISSAAVQAEGGADGNAAGDNGGDCNGQGLSAGWIICGVVEIVSAFSDFAFNEIIQPIMEQSPLSTDTSDPTYRSWQGFRFIANILLVISMLAIVYTQAKGGE